MIVQEIYNEPIDIKRSRVIDAARQTTMTKGNDESDHHLMERLFKLNESPLEFASFTFQITGISRVCTLQLVRHRIASYAQLSQRRVKHQPSISSIMLPEPLANNDEVLELLGGFLASVNNIQSKYNVKAEDIRYLYPQGIKTDLIMQMNLRSLINFLRLRTSPHAQKEIRELSEKILAIVAHYFPEVKMLLSFDLTEDG